MCCMVAQGDAWARQVLVGGCAAQGFMVGVNERRRDTWHARVLHHHAL